MLWEQGCERPGRTQINAVKAELRKPVSFRSRNLGSLSLEFEFSFKETGNGKRV